MEAVVFEGKHSDVTEKVIGAFFKVSDTLGYGFAEGEYFADILVNDAVILELKAVRHLLEEHEAQLLNYLKATTTEVGLLLNFGPKAEYRRKVYDNELKGTLTWTNPKHTTHQ